MHPGFLGRKAMTNLGNVLKSRDITLLAKVYLVQAMVFPVVMYGCESWTIKKAEHWKIDAFELWCWRRLLRVPWTARRSNQSILKKISPGVHWKDWCWSWNSNTLATWCEELTHLKRPWCRERLKMGGERDDRGWDGWMASLSQWTWVSANSGKILKDREDWCAAVHWVSKSWTQLSRWTTTTFSSALELRKFSQPSSGNDLYNGHQNLRERNFPLWRNWSQENGENASCCFSPSVHLLMALDTARFQRVGSRARSVNH